MAPGLLLAFLFRENTIHVAGVGVYLAIVGYGDMLRAVLFVPNAEKLFVNQFGVASFDMMLARFQAERQADHGGSLAFDFGDQNGFV